MKKIMHKERRLKGGESDSTIEKQWRKEPDPG
nr:MAG TPA: hypothetical protein [Caudoviricetes sp.]